MKITQPIMRSFGYLRNTRRAWLGLFVLICVFAAALPATGSAAADRP